MHRGRSKTPDVAARPDLWPMWLSRAALRLRRFVSSGRRLRVLPEVWRLRRSGCPEARKLADALIRATLGRPRRDELTCIKRIEAERRRIESSDRQISWKGGRLAPVSMIARRSSVPRREGIVLMSLVRAFGPARGLELGTSVGVSAAYQASGMQLTGYGALVSLEGYRDLAEQARELWSGVGLNNVTAVVGRFRESLPRVLAEGDLDYAFVDGNHQEAATLAYFDRITARANPGALLVFDDINWSPGMRRAWQQIRTDTRVAAYSTTGRFGLVVLAGQSYERGGV